MLWKINSIFKFESCLILQAALQPGKQRNYLVFKHMLAGGLRRPLMLRFPALMELQDIPLADFGVV